MLNVKMPTNLPPLLDADRNANISILKISCEDKFYIAKTINIEWMIGEIRKVYGKYARQSTNTDFSKNLYFPLVKHIYMHDIHRLKVEVLFTTINGYEALKYELGQLEEWFGKKECLNKNNIPHIPKTIMAKTGANWLTQNQALNFRKLLTKYEY